MPTLIGDFSLFDALVGASVIYALTWALTATLAVRLQRVVPTWMWPFVHFYAVGALARAFRHVSVRDILLTAVFIGATAAAIGGLLLGVLRLPDKVVSGVGVCGYTIALAAVAWFGNQITHGRMHDQRLLRKWDHDPRPEDLTSVLNRLSQIRTAAAVEVVSRGRAITSQLVRACDTRPD